MSEVCDMFPDAYNAEAKLLEKIRYAKGLYEYQVEKVKKEQHILDLLHRDYARCISARRSRYDYVDIYSKAQEEVGKRLKRDRPHFEAIKSFLMEDFLDYDKNFKLTNIISCGYENYGWEFIFTGYGKTIFIRIPYMRNINYKNLEYINHGMFTFGVQEAEHIWKVLKGSYEMSEIAATIKDYVRIWSGEVSEEG